MDGIEQAVLRLTPRRVEPKDATAILCSQELRSPRTKRSETVMVEHLTGMKDIWHNVRSSLKNGLQAASLLLHKILLWVRLPNRRHPTKC